MYYNYFVLFVKVLYYMSTKNSSLHTVRFKQAAQWIQAITTLIVLALLYSSQNLMGGEMVNGKTPNTPPAQNFEQVSYWNEDFKYGFRGENNDKYQKKDFSGGEIVAVDPKEGVIFEDARVRVSFYQNLSIEEIEKKHPSDRPRAFSRLDKGIAVIDGDLDSPTAKTILATLHTR